MSNENEKVRDVFAEMRRIYDGSDKKYAAIDAVVNSFVNRLEKSYESEMAAKDAEIERLKKLYDSASEIIENTRLQIANGIADKDARIALLERAMKPVIECNTNDIILTSDESACARGFDECMNAVEAVENAQRVMQEGGK